MAQNLPRLDRIAHPGLFDPGLDLAAIVAGLAGDNPILRRELRHVPMRRIRGQPDVPTKAAEKQEGVHAGECNRLARLGGLLGRWRGGGVEGYEVDAGYGGNPDGAVVAFAIDLLDPVVLEPDGPAIDSSGEPGEAAANADLADERVGPLHFGILDP